ncbi:MAG: OmpH family outer membrane protein [Candidatus Latescibacterota bacterium]|jgi:outer membrane protein|nr:MAG: OmpH family outer membrane protein [Candidatus Latescibacterota bacterium]
MKRIAALVLVSFLAAQLAPLALRAEEVKIGYIDTVKIFAEYKETIDAEAIYKKEVEAWKKKQSDLEAELARLREEIQSQSLMLSEEKLAEKRQTFDKKVADYNKYMSETFSEEGLAAKRNKELTAPIVEKINGVIAKLAEEEGYSVIFDAAQGNIVYAKKALDLTERVTKLLDEQMQKAQ